MSEQALTEKPSASTDLLAMDIREHGITFVLPEGAVLDGATLTLPGGALIMGVLRGSIHCRNGSLIVARQGEFSGNAKADRVYIEGSVRQKADGTNSTLHGHRLVAVSELAKGSADLIAAAFSINTTSFTARFTTKAA
jgi:hypothetical protein